MNMTLTVQQHILWFQVKVDQVVRVQVLQTQQHLATVEGHSRFTQTAQLQALSKGTATVVIENKTERGGCLEGEVESREESGEKDTWEGEGSGVGGACCVR